MALTIRLTGYKAGLEYDQYLIKNGDLVTVGDIESLKDGDVVLAPLPTNGIGRVRGWLLQHPTLLLGWEAEAPTEYMPFPHSPGAVWCKLDDAFEAMSIAQSEDEYDPTF